MLQLLDELTNAAGRWRQFDPFHRGFANLFDDPFSLTHNSERLPLNVYANEDTVKAVVRAPGWKAEWFNISVEGDKVLLKGETRHERGEDGYAYENLSRVVNLPFRVEPKTVKASYVNGLLTVEMSRREQDKPRKIAVQAA